MREDFAVFILTHGRADNVVTKKTLEKGGYTGKWYMIIDDEDDQKDLYIKNFGEDHVIVFDKQKAYDRTDTMDNFNDHRAIIYARNESWRIAKNLGLTYFLMLDDDYKSIDYRYADGKACGIKQLGISTECLRICWTSLTCQEPIQLHLPRAVTLLEA